MDKVELADAVYERAFPAVIMVCAIAGIISFALMDYTQAISAFAAIGIGVKANGIIERRRYERSERLAAIGWNRMRSPLNTL